MEEQQINGGLNQGVGRLKEAAGALLGDIKTQAGGRAQQLRGQAETIYGDAMDRLTTVTTERPAVALGAALGIGVVIGLLLAR
jgi:uncharacterized protein YjbJ (UPF0337 family)